MLATNSDIEQHALYAFEIIYSAMLRAIRTGKARVIPCLPDGSFHTVTVEGTDYRLDVSQDALSVILDAEPGAMARARENVEGLGSQCKQLLKTTADLIKENEMLRSALSPYEQVILHAIRDPENGELVGSRSIKKIR